MATPKRIRFVAATTAMFTEDELKKLADSAPGLPITNNFDSATESIGWIISALVEDGKLVMTGELSFTPDRVGRVVPCYEATSFKSISYGYTDTPCDKSLEPITWEDKEGNHNGK